MSRYESESGTFKLPTAEFSKFRKKMEQADRREKERLFEAAQRVWKSIPPADRRDGQRFVRAVERKLWPGAAPGALDAALPRVEGVTSENRERLERIMQPRWNESPKRITKADMDFPTNRTTQFDTGEGAVISFNRDESTVTWSVPENNRAVEHARETPMAEAFFTALDQVRWTPGTGGLIYGNDEYNRDAGGWEGAGGDYCTGAYGPIGAAENPYVCRPYTDSKGRRIADDGLREAGERESRRHRRALKREAKQVLGSQGRVPRGVPTGGQFASKHHAEGDIQL